MTTAEIEKALREWSDVQQVLSRNLAEAARLLGTTYDRGTLWPAVLDVAAAHTRAVAAQVGDGAEWLEYWQTECRYGERPRDVEVDGVPMLMATIADLAVVVSS